MKSDPIEINSEKKGNSRIIPRISISSWNLWLIRIFMHLVKIRKPAEDVIVRNIFIPGKDKGAQIRVRLYQPKAQKSPVPALLWLHGGGMVMGNPEIDETICLRYIRELGIVIASVDYRLAPENRFPIPLEDAYSALTWMYSHYAQLGIDPERIAIGGESAGGGLAAALAQLAHDRKEIEPVCQLLIFPMLDDRSSIRADIDNRHLTWNQPNNLFGWEAYLGKKCGTADLPEYSVPARQVDLSGLPPAWIGVGTLDLFHDEDKAYAQRLQASGVACEFYVVPGATHGFDHSVPQSQVVKDFQKSQIEALRHYLFAER
jgi:acetyl esterase/lipase